MNFKHTISQDSASSVPHLTPVAPRPPVPRCCVANLLADTCRLFVWVTHSSPFRLLSTFLWFPHLLCHCLKSSRGSLPLHVFQVQDCPPHRIFCSKRPVTHGAGQLPPLPVALAGTHILPFVVLFPQLVIYQLQLLLAGPAVRLHCSLLLTSHVKHTRAPECGESRDKNRRGSAPVVCECLGPFCRVGALLRSENRSLPQPAACTPAPPPLLLQQKPKYDHLCLQWWMHQVNVILHTGAQVCLKKS